VLTVLTMAVEAAGMKTLVAGQLLAYDIGHFARRRELSCRNRKLSRARRCSAKLPSIWQAGLSA
jgi:hypothetical protein